MTDAQERAIRELDRICQSAPNDFEVTFDPILEDGGVTARVLIHIGPLETKEGGLNLRDREEFLLVVPPGFPFDRPHLNVSHRRFAGFPHVIWGKTICLYQSDNEWNPSDGLYGFFDRLNAWLSKAAVNDMDPIEAPLEPPHHVTAFSQKPFVIRANAPSPVGTLWTGVAILHDYPNRTELVGWNDLSGDWPKAGRVAFAAMLPKPINSEFPKKGADLFAEFEGVGVDRDLFIRSAAFAAMLATEGDPVHFVLGLPMRRSAEGLPRLHIAVWTASAEWAKNLRVSVLKDTDSEELKAIRTDLRNAILKALEESTISWCKILEDRDEIVLRRDTGSLLSWFEHKKILILGCGALGSWAAEVIARAGAEAMELVDNSIVKPGVLSRQNFMLADIGENKAKALATKVRLVAARCVVTEKPIEAYKYFVENKDHLATFDLIIDCTASFIFQMKMEREWLLFSKKLPPIISILIDGSARHSIAVVVNSGASGGIWSAYLSLKKSLCTDGTRLALIEAFYADRSKQPIFLPEPGCSDPTFIGSTADVMVLLSSVLNAVSEPMRINANVGLALTAQRAGHQQSAFDVIPQIEFVEARAGKYRVRLAANLFKQARAWVQQSSRLRGASFETGGLLWGTWDDAINVIWIFDASGPPPDSQHSPAEFICGTKGTIRDHERRMRKTFGVSGFVGHWHTHPDIPSEQSGTDMVSMATLVAAVGGNQKRSIMLIFGRTYGTPTAGLYVYESQSTNHKGERVSVGVSQIALTSPVV